MRKIILLAVIALFMSNSLMAQEKKGKLEYDIEAAVLFTVDEPNEYNDGFLHADAFEGYRIYRLTGKVVFPLYKETFSLGAGTGFECMDSICNSKIFIGGISDNICLCRGRSWSPYLPLS